MKPLFLVGYMGCGKSTLGRKIARRLGMLFTDTDHCVEEREGATIADLFQYEGEEQFRTIEREVLEQIIARGDAVVVSTGGGLPTWRDNMQRMNTVGSTIYLKRSATQIASRLSPYGRSKRPRLRNLSDDELVDFMARDMAEREKFYSQATWTFDCSDKTDEELVELLVMVLRNSGPEML